MLDTTFDGTGANGVPLFLKFGILHPALVDLKIMGMVIQPSPLKKVDDFEDMALEQVIGSRFEPALCFDFLVRKGGVGRFTQMLQRMIPIHDLHLSGKRSATKFQIERGSMARPIQAAWISAAAFASFALVPIAGLLAAPAAARLPAIAAASLAALAALGALGGHLGGAPRVRAALRVTLGGGLAMAVTAAIGRLLGVMVG